MTDTDNDTKPDPDTEPAATGTTEVDVDPDTGAKPGEVAPGIPADPATPAANAVVEAAAEGANEALGTLDPTDDGGRPIVEAGAGAGNWVPEGAFGDHGGSTTGLSNVKMGMWLFLASECLLFGGLISTYMLYRGRHTSNLGPDQIYDIPFTSVSSFVLLMSSLTMVLAVSAAHRKDERNARLWLVITAVLGATFVGGQVYEFTSFYREGLGYTTSLFSSSFYTLTGFHGVHVTLGIVMLLSTVFMLRGGRITEGKKAESIEIVGLYWHFVDIVWIIIFTLVYLIPA